MVVIRSEDIKDVCSNLKVAVNADNVSVVTSAVEVSAESNKISLSLTNREYFVTATIATDCDDTFKATVQADLFLNLIPQITTETIELSVVDNSLVVHGNGDYKIPLLYDNESMVSLPRIPFENETVSFDIQKKILTDILKYNKHEMASSVATHPVQKMYYIDEKGCITFSTGACVTSFSFPSNVRMLLSPKVVDLFKLLSDDSIVFKLGHVGDDENIRDVAMFKDSSVSIICYLPTDSSLINSVPVDAIRDRAKNVYDYSVVINKSDLITAINRLMVFTTKDYITRPYSEFTFNGTCVSIKENKSLNTETILYTSESDSLSDSTYSMTLDLLDVKSVLEAYKFEDVTLSFGNGQAAVFSQSDVYNVVPECVI